MTGPGRTRLASWKEIASYLGREVRTVIRWEKERGLPVHRVPGGRGRSVYAFTDELDRWSVGEQTAEPFRPRFVRPRWTTWLAVGATIVLAMVGGVAAGILNTPTHREIDRFVVDHGTGRALDRVGETIWSHSFPAGTYAPDRPLMRAVDLTGDSHPDVIASVVLGSPESDIGEGTLFAFDERGQRLWEHTLDRRLSFGAEPFDPPWMPDDVTVFTNGGETFVAWAVHHLTWWPSMLAVLDSKGASVGTFVNAGWIRTVRPTRDGRHLVAGGFSNSRNGAAFAILDARRPNGASPEEPGSPYECRDCPAGRPLHYLVVDWSDIASSLPPDDRDVIVSVHPGTGNIELRARQRWNAEMIVELSPAFEVRRRAASDAFWEWHRRFEQNRTVTHGRETCPYRDGPIVRAWSPGQGWTVVK